MATHARTNHRAMRSLFILGGVLAAMLIAVPSALAVRRHYDLNVQGPGGRFVGKTEFNYSYVRTRAGDKGATARHIPCYNARATGSVKDTAKDGNSVKVYLASKSCGTRPGKTWIELGFAGKPEDPADRFDFKASQVVDGVVHVCTWTAKRGIIKCTPGISDLLRNALNKQPHSQQVLNADISIPR
jgi:hypothetical protein